jgi:hypothetical protein
MALALPFIGLTMLTGYLLNKDESVISRKNVATRTAVIENDKPNGENIYSSNKANEADFATFYKSVQNYKDAQDPAITGVLPPIFNTYSANGNTNVLTQNAQSVPSINSEEMNKINEMNRRADILNDSSKPSVNNRPMFNPVYSSLESVSGPFNELQNSEFVKDAPSNDVNPLTGLSYETQHENMTPFFGSAIKQNIEQMTNTSMLDLYTGNNSTFQHKKEIKPFYTLMKQDINGTPSITLNTDMDRFIPSNFKQNEKPFYEKRIAAPISGTIDNDIRVYGQSVDELRVASKPKLTYEARTVSGQFMNVRGIQPQVNKNLVDRYYVQTPDMLLKTTGAITGEATRDNFVIKPTSREATSSETYIGPSHSALQVKSIQRAALINGNNNEGNQINQDVENAQNNNNGISKSLVQDPKRQSFKTDFIRNYNTNERKDANYDYGKTTYTPYITERSLNGETNQFDLNVNKQNKGQKVYLQDDAKSTIKQTTLLSDNSGHLKSFDKGSISAIDAGLQHWDAKATNKQALINNKYIGGMKKDEGMGYSVAKYIAKTTGKEIISANSNYTGNSSADAIKNTTIYSTYSDPIKTRNVTSVHYTGSSAPVSRQDSASRHNYTNAEISDRQEQLLTNERPSGPNVFQISSGSDSQGQFKYTDKMKLKEEVSYRKLQDINEFINPKLPHLTTPVQNIGRTENKKEASSESENTRLEPFLIRNQLKNNPFIIDGPNRI